MKKLSTYVTIYISLLIGWNSVYASHGTGGELTWRCNGNGQYIFQLKFYRDCNGIPGPNSVQIHTTVPGLPYIQASLISQTDISPQGFFSSGVDTCPTCAQGNFGNPLFGIIEEFILESAPVTLNGVPPPSGWTFEWGECCRSSALTNIMNAGSIGFSMQAKMYAYQGQNANPCFDASPFFAEKPNSILCSNLPIVYNHLSIDPEFDSLSYEFDDPIDDMGNVVPFAPGFSAQNPLPGVSTLNSYNGELSFTSSTAGYYVTVVKVSSYKCGIKTAEIRREINVLISNNCLPVLGNIANSAPAVLAPFQDSNGLYTQYSDTIFAGDTITFAISATDSQYFNNNVLQTITMNAFGQQYGLNFTDPNTGCLIPPCATLAVQPPVSSPGTVTNQFNWTTTTAHLGYSFSCVQFSNTYFFINKVQDNYCPANGTNNRVFTITVLPAIPPPPVIFNGGTLECNLGSNYIYQWFLDRFAIPGAVASSYTPTQTGNYQVLAVAPDGQGNYSDGYFFIALGMPENENITNISVQPNPSANGIFQVNTTIQNDSWLNLLITDVYGRVIFHQREFTLQGGHSFNVDLSNEPSGVYFTELKDDNSRVRKVKIISTR